MLMTSKPWARYQRDSARVEKRGGRRGCRRRPQWCRRGRSRTRIRRRRRPRRRSFRGTPPAPGHFGGHPRPPGGHAILESLADPLLEDEDDSLLEDEDVSDEDV